MRRSRMPIAIVFLASTAVVLGARTTTTPVLIPGSSDVTTGHIKTAAAGYRYLTRAPTGDTTERALGTGHTEQVLTAYKGKPAVLLVASFDRPGGQTFLDSALVMHAGLVPVWETSRVGPRVTHYEYAGKQVR